jgi:hypothetical protein
LGRPSIVSGPYLNWVEFALITVLFCRIVAQLVPYGMANASIVENVGEVFSQGHHVSFRWDDLVAVAPWMEERLTRRDDGA